MCRLRPTRRRQRPWIPCSVDSPPDPRNAASLVYVYTILYDRLARFYSRDITNTSPPWPITYNLYLSTDGATVENGPAHAPYPSCHGKEAKPRSVTMDLRTNDPVGPSAHTCTLLTCLLRRRPSDRRRQTQGLHPPEDCSESRLDHKHPVGSSAQTCTLAAPAVSSRLDPNPSAEPERRTRTLNGIRRFCRHPLNPRPGSSSRWTFVVATIGLCAAERTFGSEATEVEHASHHEAYERDRGADMQA